MSVIGNQMCVKTSRFTNVWSQAKHIGVIFTHLKLWIAVARHNFKLVKITSDNLAGKGLATRAIRVPVTRTLYC